MWKLCALSPCCLHTKTHLCLGVLLLIWGSASDVQNWYQNLLASVFIKPWKSKCCKKASLCWFCVVKGKKYNRTTFVIEELFWETNFPFAQRHIEMEKNSLLRSDSMFFINLGSFCVSIAAVLQRRNLFSGVISSHSSTSVSVQV